MIWDQLRPGLKFELMTSPVQVCSLEHPSRLFCHLLKPIYDTRQVLTTLPVRDGFNTESPHLAYPAGTRLQVRFSDPALGCWLFQAGIAAYGQHRDVDALVLSAWSSLSPCERRVQVRQKCSIPVKLVSIDETVPIKALMVNYSAGGVHIITDRSLPLDRRFVIVLSTGLGRPLSARCRIVRQERILVGFNDQYRIALQFEELQSLQPFLMLDGNDNPFDD